MISLSDQSVSLVLQNTGKHNVSSDVDAMDATSCYQSFRIYGGIGFGTRRQLDRQLRHVNNGDRSQDIFVEKSAHSSALPKHIKGIQITGRV